MASQVGEAGALRLHATELLMMLGTAIVLVFDQPAQKPAPTSDAALRELQLANNG